MYAQARSWSVWKEAVKQPLLSTETAKNTKEKLHVVSLIITVIAFIIKKAFILM